MEGNEKGYPIRAVAQLTGLSVDTLRAWERRYKAVSPQRQGRGRVYNEGLKSFASDGYAYGESLIDNAKFKQNSGTNAGPDSG